jgi:hypothetical protein
VKILQFSKQQFHSSPTHKGIKNHLKIPIKGEKNSTLSRASFSSPYKIANSEVEAFQ